MEENFLKKATNPQQYDTSEIVWEKEGLHDSPSRRFFKEYLKKYLDVNGKTVLDVGSGMGQLFPLLKELGAIKIEGLEPSAQNVKVSLSAQSDVSVFQGTLDEFPEKFRYDVIVSVMVLEHIEDLYNAFNKIKNILASNGSLVIVVADKEYALTPRFGYEIESQDLGDGNVVVKTIRHQGIGTLCDILRPIENYILVAKESGFILDKHVELKPTENFIKDDPRYVEFKDHPICHLLAFKKED